jgi:hypothetical protein
VIWERPSRHSGLEVTVVARRQGRAQPPFLAYLHTPDRSRVVAVSNGPSPEQAAHRVDTLLTHARTYRLNGST